jgi:DNA topoisomerase-1
MNLFIVESPGKIKKIESILGSGFKVAASLGHIRDLPINEMGVEYDSWKLKYVLTDKGKKTYSNLKALADKADRVYFATDLDREGEAIAWHLAVMLKIPVESALRVKFNSITKEAITKAVASPIRIDLNLVRAQEARRSLDRLVGYMVSPVLSRKMNLKLSAGRVQSVMLRLIVDRFLENQSFESESYFGAELNFGSFKAAWDVSSWLNEGEKYNFDRSLAEEAGSVAGQVTVVSVESKLRKRMPGAPFTTSGMQKAATKVGLSMADAMKAAQELYEKAFITYHRTDSVVLAPESVALIREFAVSKSLPVPDKPNTFKSKVANSQEAHEAIRPTDLSVESVEGVSASAVKLYELIYKQTLASQLAPAQIKDTAVRLESECGQFEYAVKGSVVVEPGFMVFSGQSDDVILPNLIKGQLVRVHKGRVLDQKTKAPALYTEASILSELEKLGVGRPATWAAIMTNISRRGYIGVTKSKALEPTEVGIQLRKALEGFGFMEYQFTARSEDDMDQVSNGELSYSVCVDRVFRQVFSDVRDRLEYHGTEESFFLPPELRDYVSTPKQVAAVKKVAVALGLELGDLDLSSGRAVSDFLKQHATAYKNSFVPTEKQVAYAEILASALGIKIEPDVLKSMVKLSTFIDKHKKEALSLSKPSQKQKDLAIKLSETKGVSLPKNCLESLSVCSDFIGQYLKKGKRKSKEK